MGIHHHQLTLLRRGFLASTAATGITAFNIPLWAHNDAGMVDPPAPPPTVALTLHSNVPSTLQKVLKDHVTAVQLIFTTCQATCPIQGALFASAAKKLGDRLKLAQLLSISIDPGNDTPAALEAWLKRFGISPRWTAARPDKQQLDNLVAFLKSKKAAPDPHTGQVYYFNREGELALRSVDFPPAAQVVQTLESMLA